MNRIVGIILAIVVILGAVWLISRSPEGAEDGGMTGEGRVIFSVTDAAVDLETLSEVNMRVSRVDIHSAGGSWTTVSSTPRSFELLALNESGENRLLADIETAAGTYDQVRLFIDQANVVTSAGATHEAHLPSNELTLDSRIIVRDGETSSANFDFLADSSLHVTAGGEYVFAPVVRAETRSDANVTVDANGLVSISGGSVDSASTFGMDVDGSVKLNFILDEATRIDLEGDAIIKLDALLK